MTSMIEHCSAQRSSAAAAAMHDPEGAPIVVGIPSRNEAKTIGGVVTTAVQGLRELGLHTKAVVVNCDNGSSDRTPEAFLAAAKDCRNMRLSAPGPAAGKGANIRRILEYAADIGAGWMILLDADLRSAQPHWIARLLSAVLGVDPVVATPVYTRNRFEGNTTNHLASPLMRAVFGSDVQQPIAGDFAFNRAFIENALTWQAPASSQLYGIDIWLTANAASRGINIAEVPLGRKLHNPGFPKILHGSQQVIDSLFHVVARHAEISPPATALPARSSADRAAHRPDTRLVEQAVAKVRAYVTAEAGEIEVALPASRHLAEARWGWRVGPSDWAELLADTLQLLGRGDLIAARDHLVAMYFCRVMTYWEEIDGLSAGRIDRLLANQTASICEAVRRRHIEFCGRELPVKFTAGYWAPGEQ